MLNEVSAMVDEHKNDDQTQSYLILSQGTTVGHYRIIEKIGGGGMGEVYLALDTRLNRKVALKFLSPHLCQDEYCRKRFTREAQAAAKLNHPNIVSIYEVGEHQRWAFIAMEHVEGQSLQELSVDRDLPIEQILEFGVQMCEGLDDAHEKGVTHRDIKPSNILIDSHGRVKIVDFGLASIVGADQLTKTGSTIGTIGYMSPEQVQGKEIDHRSDLFSLGVVLYELITKQNPFKRDSEAATMNSVLDHIPEPLVRYKNDVSDELQRIIFKLLEKASHHRYQTARDIVADLRRMREMSEKQLSDYRASARRKVFWRSLPVLVLTAIILLVLILKQWRFQTSSTDSVIAAPQRLAVLYLKNLGSHNDEYLSYGITEDLTVDLTRIGSIGVVPMRSVLQYKDTLIELNDIARKLRANLILDGSLHKTDSVIHVSAQLVDISSGVNLWAERWEEKVDNLPHIKEALAQGVSHALTLDASAMRAAQIGSPDAQNPVAYDYYLRGKYVFEHKADKSDVEIALGLLEKAVELEPLLLAARISIADILLYKSEYERAKEELSTVLSNAQRLHFRSDEAGALRSLALYYGIKSLWSMALDSAHRAVQISVELGDLAGEVEGLSLVIELHRMNREFDRAISLFGRVFEINHQLDDKSAEAQSLSSMGNVFLDKRENDSAKAYYEKALGIAISCEDKSLQARLIHSIGALYLREGDFDVGLQKLNEAMQIYRQLDQQRYIAEAFSLIARIYEAQGDFEKALYNSEQAAEIYTGFDNQPEMASVFFLKGRIYADQGDFDKALHFCERAQKIYDRFDNQQESAIVSHQMARIFADQGNNEGALQYYEKAFEAFAQIGEKRGMLGMLAGMINHHISIGHYRKSLEYAEKAEEILVELGEHEHLIGLRNVIGSLQTRLGEYDTAIPNLLKLLPVALESDDSSLYADIHQELGLAYLYKEEYTKAHEFLIAALTLFEKLNDQSSLATCNRYLGEMFYFQEMVDSSRRHFEIMKNIACEINARNIEIIALAYLASMGVRTGEGDNGIVQLQILVAETTADSLWEEHVVVQRLLGQTLLEHASGEEDRNRSSKALKVALAMAKEKEMAHEIRRLNKLLEKQPQS